VAERGGPADWLVALPVRAAFRLFGWLSPATASHVGGALGRWIGPRLGISKVARRNLARAMPELDAATRERIVVGMWDNLGRVIGEYPHLAAYEAGTGTTLEVVGAEHFEAARADGIGGIFFSGHFGNWELLAPVAGQLGMPLTLVYRAANNPHVEALVQRARAQARGAGEHFPKGAAARVLVGILRRHGHIAMLVDQKMNDGIAAPFFGRHAMTTSAPAEFALRFHLPVIPARVERLGGGSLRVIVEPPLELPDSGDREADVRTLTTAINARLETWIRARPDHWFWLHRRWPES
jgi:Kdo2-lipid IVA lauroyltransferase/acyltransferase